MCIIYLKDLPMNFVQTEFFGDQEKIPEYGNIDEYHQFALKYIRKMLNEM